MTTFMLNLPINAHIQKTPLTPNFTKNYSSKFVFKTFKKTRSFSKTYTIVKSVIGDVETTTTSELGQRWPEIHGQNNWSGMLDPMDPLLRSEVIRYGEMTQACYSGFDNDPFSKNCGSCRFSPRSFFQDLELEALGYEVTAYLYSSNTSELVPKFFSKSLMSDGPWNPKVNWIGYVAVSNDETTARLGRREIAIAWRGTVTKLEWVEDLISFLKPVSAENLASPDPDIKVMAGFLHVYTDKDGQCPYSKFSAREQVLAELARLLKIYENEVEKLSITIMGHSLGSAVAILNAYDIAESKLNVINGKRVVPVSVFSFAGPRLGNTRFKKRLEAIGVKVLRVFNIRDKVPTVPGVIFNEKFFLFQLLGDWATWFYTHVGEELGLDHQMSPYVNESLAVADLHNLEFLLHLVDGYHGKGKKFSLTSGRDIALVNKETDVLKKEYLIPPYWLQVENKRLVKNENGEWRLPEQGELELKEHLHLEDVEHFVKELGLA